MSNLKRLASYVAICAIAWMGLSPIAAQANDELVVYIECITPDGVKTQGSGVLVSEIGHVLTARHVVPDGSTCRAGVGTTTNKRDIALSYEHHYINPAFDGAILRFLDNEDRPFASVCPVTEQLKERDISAWGFSPNNFSEPIPSNGILSTTNPNSIGILPTTPMTAKGKSGGPVFLEGTTQIVGIIAGAEFDTQGIPSTSAFWRPMCFSTNLTCLKPGTVK